MNLDVYPIVSNGIYLLVELQLTTGSPRWRRTLMGWSSWRRWILPRTSVVWSSARCTRSQGWQTEPWTQPGMSMDVGMSDTWRLVQGSSEYCWAINSKHLKYSEILESHRLEIIRLFHEMIWNHKTLYYWNARSEMAAMPWDAVFIEVWCTRCTTTVGTIPTSFELGSSTGSLFQSQSRSRRIGWLGSTTWV